MTLSEEMLIRGVAKALHAAADTLMSLVVRETPDDAVRCPQCKSTHITEAGSILVCADCNHNFAPTL